MGVPPINPDNYSVAERLSLLPPDEMSQLLEELAAGDDDEWEYSAEFWLRPSQLECLHDDSWLVAFLAGRGSGKALHDDTLIPTSDPAQPFTRIADLRPGDQVFDHTGHPTEVLGVYPQGTVKCVRLHFNDGTSIVASDDHLWTAFHGKNRYHYYTANPKPTPDWPSWRRPQQELTPIKPFLRTSNGVTRLIAPRPRTNKQRLINSGATTRTSLEMLHANIPLGFPLVLPPIELPVDPYIFGAWLGDGSTNHGSICAGREDVEFMLNEFMRRGYPPSQLKQDSRTGVWGWKSERLHAELKAISLSRGNTPTPKSVPPIFLRGSIEQRLDFVRGLMDTDGSNGKKGTAQDAGAGFMNEAIADGLDNALTSLGYLTRRSIRMYEDTPTRPRRPFFSVLFRPTPDMNPFALPRKRDRVTEMPNNQSTRKTTRRVTAVERTADLPATCIKVAAPDELFLAGKQCVPTHNTRVGAHWTIEKARIPGTRIHLVGRTVADVRDVMIEGESGIMAASSPKFMPQYIPSIRKLIWPNGSTATTFCVTPDTEALTRDRGWQTHDKLEPGDVIYTLNTHSGLGEWQPITQMNRFDVTDEPMMLSSGRFHSSCTTMNHRWPVRGFMEPERGRPTERRRKSSGRVYTQRTNPSLPPPRLVTQAGIQWRTTEEIMSKQKTLWNYMTVAPAADLPTEPKYSDALVELVAWTMTEGHSRPHPRTGRATLILKQSLSVNPHHHASITRALNEMFGPPRLTLKWHTHGGSRPIHTGETWYTQGDGFTLDHAAAAHILEHFEDPAPNPHHPEHKGYRSKVVRREFIYSLTRSQLRLFVDRCTDGDGSRRGDAFGMVQNHAGRDDIYALALTLLGTPYQQFEKLGTYNDTPYWTFSTSSQPKADRPHHNRELVTFTGTVWCPTTENSTWFARCDRKVFFTGNSADSPSQLRGPQSHATWADETAAWKQVPDDSGATAWDHVLIGTRLGAKPQTLATTTPKRIRHIKDIVARAKTDPAVSIHTGSTFDNAANLSAEYLATLADMYSGTALERQELYGELLLIVEAALWQESDFRYGQPTPDQDQHRDLITVIGVDPSASSKGDATGIIVVQATTDRQLRDRHAWVRADLTAQGPPEKWSGIVHDLQREWSRPGRPALVIAEKNQGGEMVASALHQHDPGMPVALIHAARSKAVRAEPIVLCYRQRRVWHSDEFEELQEELTTWEPDSKWSPNRMDALVHALSAVLIDDTPLRRFGTITAGDYTLGQTIPGSIPSHRRERGKISFGSWRGRRGT